MIVSEKVEVLYHFLSTYFLEKKFLKIKLIISTRVSVFAPSIESIFN